jgi:sugar lactone lactonase YvrE
MVEPLVHPETPRVVVPSGCILGEGPVWDHRTGTLIWVDIKAPAIWRYRPETGESSSLDVAEPVGFVALTPNPDVVVAGFKSGLVRVHLSGGEIQPLVAPEPDKPGNRLNDGHVGPEGTLYFGSMDDAQSKPTGSFWRWDGVELEPFHAGICITNGPAVSPDGRLLYTTDTQRRVIFKHDLTAGRPGDAKVHVRFEKSWGHPDGMAVDAEGYIWVCHWGAARITRFAPDGAPERVVPMPTPQITKCAFGGPDLDTVYITTAAIGRDPKMDPMAGHLFSVATDGIRGLPAAIFGGATPE